MRFVFEEFIPDTDFWIAYSELWKNSQYQSSFQAPHFLRSLITHIKTPLIALRAYRDEKLTAATFFSKRGIKFHFLSDQKTDHNFFILHKSITPEETNQYFQFFFKEISRRKWAFRLNKQPSWAIYMEVFREALSESHLYRKIVPYNPCLVLETETPDALFKATNKQKLRQKLNRLKDKGDVIFEALQAEEDLDLWLEEFYEVHVKKWAGTSTPSRFTKTSDRLFYTSCIKAWIEDGVLVRFSIKLNNRRIAFVTALLENGYLVHHTTSFDKEFEKQSPGLIIINLIGQWMAERKMTKMEFGDGGETYKYQFINREFPLYIFFITHCRNYPFIINIRLVHLLRRNKKLLNYYNNRIRPVLLRSRLFRKKIS